ncbi:hypothetical protein TorRG33x02_254240 [Trema orientale]|uniref:Uncharacterized protein n=1 Tax=Trema orientale TaxID=63057 RepID=A0A2P5DEC0_TREOI|nr:hypothetical protein TorRG33x02_254240 [Trema orientale]
MPNKIPRKPKDLQHLFLNTILEYLDLHHHLLKSLNEHLHLDLHHHLLDTLSENLHQHLHPHHHMRERITEL